MQITTVGCWWLLVFCRLQLLLWLVLLQLLMSLLQLLVLLAPMLWVSDSLATLPILEKVKNAVVFITSLVPYGLVLIVIISLSIGAISITRHRTLIRRVNAVESLANVTILCFDKTGTITQNKLAVSDILPLNGTPKDEIRTRLHLYTANLAHKNGTAAAVYTYVQENKPAQSITKIKEIPFKSARKWGAIVLPEETLTDMPVLIGATGGTDRHSLVLEHAMRPMFSYLHAVVSPTAVYASTDDFGASGGQGSLGRRINKAGADFVRLLTSCSKRQPRDVFNEELLNMEELLRAR